MNQRVNSFLFARAVVKDLYERLAFEKAKTETTTESPDSKEFQLDKPETPLLVELALGLITELGMLIGMALWLNQDFTTSRVGLALFMITVFLFSFVPHVFWIVMLSYQQAVWRKKMRDQPQPKAKKRNTVLYLGELIYESPLVLVGTCSLAELTVCLSFIAMDYRQAPVHEIGVALYFCFTVALLTAPHAIQFAFALHRAVSYRATSTLARREHGMKTKLAPGDTGLEILTYNGSPPTPPIAQKKAPPPRPGARPAVPPKPKPYPPGPGRAPAPAQAQPLQENAARFRQLKVTRWMLNELFNATLVVISDVVFNVSMIFMEIDALFDAGYWMYLIGFTLCNITPHALLYALLVIEKARHARYLRTQGPNKDAGSSTRPGAQANATAV